MRIARRDAWRHKGRSVVIVVMVALPVFAVVAMDAVLRTADVSAVEGLDRTIGASDAMVGYTGAAAINQYPTELGYNSEGGGSGSEQADDPEPARRLAAMLPPSSRTITVLQGVTHYRTPLGRSFADAIEADLRDPMTAGLYRVLSGRVPHNAGEVVVSPRIADRGYRPGKALTLTDGSTRQVVGVIRWVDLSRDSRLVVATPEGLHLAEAPDTLRWWLADTARPISWAQVKTLNHEGFVALSRAVVTDPPPPSAVEASFYGDSGLDSATLGVIAMVVAMAALEVVLLAGPAFAVGVRRQQRALALVSASGGQARDVRRVVLAGGIVLGTAAAAIGVAAGVGLARLALPGAQRFSSSAFGPFEVSARDTALVAAFGIISAVLAAVVPAFAASRQDVVAVLAGRRGQTRTPIWSPVLGAILLGAGVALTGFGATRDGGETFIAGSAVLAVLGMVLLVPLVVSHLGRAAGVLPLPARFAVRDAARQRGRTAPAVAAVAATVAGVVALGIGGASDGAENKALYTPRGPAGAGVVTVYDDHQVDWARARAMVHRQVPQARIQTIHGVPTNKPEAQDGEPVTLRVKAVRPRGAGRSALGWSNSFGTDILVGTRSFDRMRLQIPAAQRDRARAALASGKVVLFQAADVAAKFTRARVRVKGVAGKSGHLAVLSDQTVPAVAITAPGTYQPANAVVPTSLTRQLGYSPAVTALVASGAPISQIQEDKINEALASVSDSASFFVERGFRDNSVAVALLVLGCVGGLLLLGGTLTATFLALSDARPDFATMRAVGAGPVTRRTVAAAYAATVGLVGAVLGAAVGFVPGIAVTYPLTSASWAEGAVTVGGAPIAGHFLDIPWTLIGALVVGLPLLTAVIVGTASRGRLPMVSRLS